ncbi:hypothetical protein L598_001100000060 [Mesorhizobium sp. J18]|uniref:hypothetical protein n=1 Tax=Mesorhizobium sp. J18 TaxID=935263 RepID=UPI00119ABCE5|nr:hypothetical protein L598_001100000060 [Mesorhizobium sp. J18]
MSSYHAARTMAMLSLLTAAGCASAPPDHSAGYSYVSTNSFTDTGKGVGGSILVPDACLGEPADSSPQPAQTIGTVVPQLGPHLPPGCANAYNLQLMAENQRDLVEGRRLGPAPAAPTVRAARRYIYGEEEAIGGAHDEGSMPDPLQTPGG